MEPEQLLPAEILAKASLAGKEYAWRLSDIPDVIDAAERANLVSVGGQLQFRLPTGTCECYWIEVDACKSLDKNMRWPERVSRSASVARTDYAELRRTKDFIAEGRDGFGPYFEEFEVAGGSLDDVMFFVWYFESKPKLRWISDLFRR
jgi:hypothetical protein